jgi:hypothetical protein
VAISAPFPGCPGNSGITADWPRCDSKMSFPAVLTGLSEMLNLLQIWKGTTLECTTVAKKRTVYFIINLVWGFMDTPLYSNNPHIEDDLKEKIQNIVLIILPANFNMQ